MDLRLYHFTYTALPEASPEDLPPDGSDGPPPEAVGAGHVSKRHGEIYNFDSTEKKKMRCSHISAPLQVELIVH